MAYRIRKYSKSSRSARHCEAKDAPCRSGPLGSAHFEGVFEMNPVDGMGLLGDEIKVSSWISGCNGLAGL